jgi:hypothetical protein
MSEQSSMNEIVEQPKKYLGMSLGEVIATAFDL